MGESRIKKGLVFGIIFVLVFVVFSGMPVNVSGEDPPFAGGSGTAADPYKISTVEQLQAMKDYLSAHFILVNDIDASDTVNWNGGAGFVPIGQYYYAKFTGNFDGNGYKIIDLYINRPNNICMSLFAATSNCEINNVYLDNIIVNGEEMVGGLVGYNFMGKISNCYASGSFDCLKMSSGSLVGYNSFGSISNCYGTGSVDGYGDVSGLVGYQDYGGSISNSYARTSVSGDYYVGGLVGRSQGKIFNSYATGKVIGSYTAGGLAGYWGSTNIFNSFWDTETTGQSSSYGGTGKTTTEMKTVATFTETDTVGLDTPWDFVDDPNDDTGAEDIWDIKTTINDGYPIFSWQITNEPPEIQTITGPGPVAVNTEMTISASFSDPDDGDTHTATWDWGDGSQCNTSTSSSTTPQAASLPAAAGYIHKQARIRRIQMLKATPSSSSRQAI